MNSTQESVQQLFTIAFKNSDLKSERTKKAFRKMKFNKPHKVQLRKHAATLTKN